jgi:hypothetical protein
VTGDLPDKPEVPPGADALPGSAVQLDTVQIEAALRDLIWRVEHVRLLLQRPAASSTAETLTALLDTTDARQALRLENAQLSGDERAVSEVMRRIG